MSDPQTDLILSLRDTVRAQIDIVEVLRTEVVRLHRRVVDLETVVGKLDTGDVFSETRPNRVMPPGSPTQGT